MAETKQKSVFEVLSRIDVSKYVKEKNKLSYLPWARAWEIIKKHYPDATYTVYPQVIDDRGNERFWHDDGKTGWVTVGVTIEGHEHIENLAIMDYKNQPIGVDEITSVSANKSKQRCLVKACAYHGLGTNLYYGEDLPESVARVEELKELIADVVKAKCKISDNAKAKVAELCKAAEKESNPDMEDDLISGNYKNIDDVNILEKLYNNVLAIRK